MKKLIVFLAIALITVLPLVSNPIGVSDDPYKHTTQSPYNYFPIELSQLGNLPIRGSIFQDGYGNSFTVYQTYPEIYNNSLLARPPFDMLILSQTPVQRMDLSLVSESRQGNVTVDANGFIEVVHLAEAELKRITITGMKPVYSDKRQYVYDIKVDIS